MVLGDVLVEVVLHGYRSFVVIFPAFAFCGVGAVLTWWLVWWMTVARWR